MYNVVTTNLQRVLPRDILYCFQAGGYINWDKTTQGFILSAYFYGFVISQLPGGYIAGRFGGKRVVLVGMFLQGVTSLLIPVAARYDLHHLKYNCIVKIPIVYIHTLLADYIRTYNTRIFTYDIRICT